MGTPANVAVKKEYPKLEYGGIMSNHDLSFQRRMAADIFGVGKHRIWMDPTMVDDIRMCASRSAVRKLKQKGSIGIKDPTVRSRFRFRNLLDQKRLGRHQGAGRVRGCKNARVNHKKIWMLRQRCLRKVLRKYRSDKKIDKHMYRTLYLKAKGNSFKNKRVLVEALFREKMEGIKKKDLEVEQAARKERSTVLLAKKEAARQKKLMKLMSV